MTEPTPTPEHIYGYHNSRLKSSLNREENTQNPTYNPKAHKT